MRAHSYEAVGNLISTTVNGVTTFCTYDANGHLIETQEVPAHVNGAQTFTYHHTGAYQLTHHTVPTTFPVNIVSAIVPPTPTAFGAFAGATSDDRQAHYTTLLRQRLFAPRPQTPPVASTTVSAAPALTPMELVD